MPFAGLCAALFITSACACQPWSLQCTAHVMMYACVLSACGLSMHSDVSMEASCPACLLQAPAHSLKFTRAVIRQALGASVEELFEEFEEVPVASGSIGQVYQAKLSAKGARNTGIDPGSHRRPWPCGKGLHTAQGKART